MHSWLDREAQFGGQRLDDGIIGLADDAVGLSAGGGFDQGHHRANIGHEPGFGGAVDVGVGGDIGDAGGDQVAQLPEFVVGEGGIEA